MFAACFLFSVVLPISRTFFYLSLGPLSCALLSDQRLEWRYFYAAARAGCHDGARGAGNGEKYMEMRTQRENLVARGTHLQSTIYLPSYLLERQHCPKHLYQPSIHSFSFPGFGLLFLMLFLYSLLTYYFTYPLQVLVGHALDNDLKCLKFQHSRVVSCDTCRFEYVY